MLAKNDIPSEFSANRKYGSFSCELYYTSGFRNKAILNFENYAGENPAET